MSDDPATIIAESCYFSAEWYSQTYPDVGLSGLDPVQHYLWYGAQMGRDPGPDFSASYYLQSYVDVALAGHNPLWHYEQFGRDEARRIAPSQRYLNWQDEDISESEIDRTRPGPTQTQAAATLAEVFATKLTLPPQRILTTFRRDLARTFVDSLCALREHELAVRGVLASVIMPSYNRADKIGGAIASVLAQSHRNFELIIVDDGSTDATAEVLQSCADDPRIRTIHAPHQGVSGARNTGLQAATGDVIFYLDTDNLWTRDFVRLMLIALEVSGARCAYAALQLRGGTSNRVNGYRGEPFDWAACLQGNYIDLNVFCHLRALYQDLGGFDTSLRRMVDWDLVLRHTKQSGAIYCPFIGCLYSDDRSDRSRISTSQSYIFQKIVARKNALGATTAVEILPDLPLNIAIKAQMADEMQTLAPDLARVLSKQGHILRIDTPTEWHAHHPHKDDLVVVSPQADADYRPNPEQLTVSWQELYSQKSPQALSGDAQADALQDWVTRQLLPGTSQPHFAGRL